MPRYWILLLVAIFSITANAAATTYYVDFQAGKDGNPGTAADTPWQHAPGDTAAAGSAKAAKLQPGDTVKFKGAVIYRGTIDINVSGAAGKPVVYDGNSSGDWGDGPAIIDGSVPLENLKLCTSAEEAWGNANYKHIYWTTVPAGADWKTINLCQGLHPLAWSQDPNPADPVLQEDTKNFHPIDGPHPDTLSDLTIKPTGMAMTPQRPFIAMFDGGQDSAVINNLNGGSIEVTLDKPVTVTEFSITPQPNYGNPKEMSFSAGGKELLKVSLAQNAKRTEQKFKLPEPATFKTLEIHFLSAYPKADGAALNWGAIAQIAGYDAAGKNVLLANRRSILRDDKVFTQTDPDFYRNAFLALYATPSWVYYKRILDFDPATHTLHIATLALNEIPYEKGGFYSIVNSPRYIDVPGEYALILDPEPDGSHKLFLWPPDGTPENLSRGNLGLGMSIRGSHLVVQGFWVRKQGGKGSVGISARGPGSDLVIRNCKVTNLRGDDVGITTTLIDDVLVENCQVAENAGHTKGIVLRNASNIVTRGCTLRHNSSTALDYYTIHNGVVQDCTVVDNPGMHANGITFYVGCKDILIERNRIRDGNVGITFQDGENMIIRNNIVEGGSSAPAVGFWAGAPYNNIVVTNNVFRFHGKAGDWAAALYGGNPTAKNYAIVNNVIDGFSGNLFRKADFHNNIFTDCGPGLPPARLGKNLLVPKLEGIFLDPAKGDYHLKPGSPAIDAGIALASINAHDIDGTPRPQSKAVDIGPYEFTGPAAVPESTPAPIDPAAFKFSLDGYTFAPPVVDNPTYEMKFKKRPGETITLKGVDLTAEGGGKVNLRPTLGGYISGWDQPGHWLEWTVNAPTAGAYEVCIEHAGQTPGSRQVLLNGQSVDGLEKVEFPITGDWTIFEKIGLPKPLILKAGKNVVRFVNVSGSHNFKTLEFIPVETP